MVRGEGTLPLFSAVAVFKPRLDTNHSMIPLNLKAVAGSSPALSLLETKPMRFFPWEFLFSSPSPAGCSPVHPSAVLELDAAQLQINPSPGEVKT